MYANQKLSMQKNNYSIVFKNTHRTHPLDLSHTLYGDNDKGGGTNKLFLPYAC